MRVVIQRVKSARVEVDGCVTGEIGSGLLVLLGVRHGDSEDDVKYLVEKTAHLRIFEDNSGRMNLSVLDAGCSVLVVSQFTLYADTKGGRRPGFSEAAAPGHADLLYRCFIDTISGIGVPVATGRFAAMMDVTLVNNGPVTIIIDSEQRGHNKKIST
ncbi:MAG: D-tyrosyl-tRNA(Tyr) deacylase [Dethiobacter sp.]|nr:D-tyrosyl-tRNA(Tyr) deacylase [Dethiobacter sp.]